LAPEARREIIRRVFRDCEREVGLVEKGKRVALAAAKPWPKGEWKGDTRVFCIDDKTKELLKKGFVSL